MRSVARITVLSTLCTLLLFPLPAQAIPAITCHCFTERTFEADRPAAADPYFLVTTHNSFFANVFMLDKKAIVIKRQQGTAAEDLWIAYWAAGRICSSAEKLLQAKKDTDTWRDVLAPAPVFGAAFSNALKARSSSSHLAALAVDDIFLRNRLLASRELAAIRQAGASDRELILAATISAKTGQPARQVYLEVKNGFKTWGVLLQAARIDTRNMQREVAALLKLQPPASCGG